MRYTLGDIQNLCIETIHKRREIGLPDRGATITIKRRVNKQPYEKAMLWGTAKLRGPVGVCVSGAGSDGLAVLQADAEAVLMWIHAHIPQKQVRTP